MRRILALLLVAVLAAQAFAADVVTYHLKGYNGYIQPTATVVDSIGNGGVAAKYYKSKWFPCYGASEIVFHFFSTSGVSDSGVKVQFASYDTARASGVYDSLQASYTPAVGAQNANIGVWFRGHAIEQKGFADSLGRKAYVLPSDTLVYRQALIPHRYCRLLVVTRADDENCQRATIDSVRIKADVIYLDKAVTPRGMW